MIKEKRRESIKEEEESSEMTDAQALQIKQNTERALSPGVNLLVEPEAIDDDNKLDLNEYNNNKDSTAHITKLDTMEVPSPDSLIKQTSNHDRIRQTSQVSIDASTLEPALSMPTEPLLWGYCELTRKELDEDQAAFLTWEHPSDGLVHAWAIFDGHGGYEGI